MADVGTYVMHETGDSRQSKGHFKIKGFEYCLGVSASTTSCGGIYVSFTLIVSKVFTSCVSLFMDI